jgi:PAS domain S-box-containing protein
MGDRYVPDPAVTVRSWLERARAADEETRGALAREMEARLQELESADAELKTALDRVVQERTRFEELFRDAPIPYLITDPEGRIQVANLAALALLPVAWEELAGQPLAAYVTAPEELEEHLARLAHRSGIEAWETDLGQRRGEPIPVLISATAGKLADGGVEVRWVLRDLREERAAREQERRLSREQAARAALEEVATRARFLSDASARLMAVLDRKAVWQIAAGLAETYARGVLLLERRDDEGTHGEGRSASGVAAPGRPLDGFVGQRVDLRQPAAGRVSLPVEAMGLALRQGEPQVVRAGEPGGVPDGVTLAVPIVGSRRPVGLMVVWLKPGAGVGEELLTHRTLGERIGLALEAATLFEEVVRARRRTEEATAAEADFLAMVSHELRTPLTAIVSYAELLEAHAADLPPNLARYVRQIAGAARHQRRLVEQVLSFREVQREAPETAEPEPLDYRDVAQFAVSMVRPQVGGKDVALITDVPPTPVKGECDPGKLRQVLANLLSNAIRHTDQGHVRLSLVEEDPYVVLTVEDTGEGIAAEDLPRIFDRFWRGGEREGRPRGSGLGLTITRELVTRMRGDIRVASEPGSGTVVTLRIPRVAARLEPPGGGLDG